MNRNQRRTMDKLGYNPQSEAAVAEAFALALDHHRAGRLAEAEALYRDILDHRPDHLDALNNLGSALRRLGRPAEAIELFRTALAINPNLPMVHNNLGTALQADGKLAEAIACFEQALELSPGAFAIRLNLGIAFQALGEHEAAAGCFEDVVVARPDLPEAHLNLGATLQALGDQAAAAACFERALTLRPDYREALLNLGNAFQNLGRNTEAAACFERVIKLRPDYPEAHYNLGNALHAEGRYGEAQDCYGRALALRPGYAKAHLNLGSTLLGLGETERAVACFERALELRPDLAAAHMNIGNVLQGQGRYEEAEARYEEALRLVPDYPEAHLNLGASYLAQGRVLEAVSCCRLATRLRPDLAQGFLNLGNALRAQGRTAEAVAAYEEAIRLRPDYAEAHNNLAMALLLRGDFAEGWRRYEWRWQVKDWPTPPRGFDAPQWDGGDLAGRTILLHAEQGAGDTFQFARYVPLVAARAKRVILECPELLERVLGRLAGGAELVIAGQPLPRFDLHCPLLSLPAAFGTTLEAVPTEVPYLGADPARRDRWRCRLAGDGPAGGGGLRVGLVWAGNPEHRQDRFRSIPLERLAPLLETGGATFYSLQVGERAGDIARLGLDGRVVDLGAELGDFADSAALLAELDLLVAVDTSIVHLAGALGRPVWVLLAHAPDWRWLLDREDSVWYPTARLFRQRKWGDWDEVVRRVATVLGDCIRGRCPPLLPTKG